MTEDTKKIGFEIPTELAETLDKYIPWGLKTKIIHEVLVILGNTLKRDGHQTITDILDGKVELRAMQNSHTTGGDDG